MTAFVMMLGIGPTAKADVPHGTAQETVCSLNQRYCASRNRGTGRVMIRRRSWDGGQPLWRARTTSQSFVVDDDGRSLVELPPGGNLVARDARADMVVLVFHRTGLPAIPLRLRDIAVDPRRLPATVSHRVWALASGYDGRGDFIVHTVDGQHLRFDPRTARRR